ncbi:MAG TPA: pyridoxamine 5'-phosphate oxidase family protein [Gemmatimonadaceae bacterium]|nr:pyridoxamine 5'-phosphate oxidase family protein [Gemmatimonadaceae bacterium]
MSELTSEKHAPSSWARAPRIRALSSLQSHFVLSRNHVGRIAFVGDGRIELIPVHYVYWNGVVVGRTSSGIKRALGGQGPEVVFEVDEPETLFEWRSVIVRGSIDFMAADLPSDRGAYWKAVRVFQTLLPDAFTERDPMPSRRVMFVIHPNEMTGRESSMSFLSRSSGERSPISG